MAVRFACLLGALLLANAAAAADLAPHQARYELRLGPALNAPRIGSATHRLGFDCRQWTLRRDVAADVAVTASLRFAIESRLDGREPRAGDGFVYDLVRVQNGARQAIAGRAAALPGGAARAEIAYPSGPRELDLAPGTMMPVAALGHLIDRLGQGHLAFPVLSFDAETVGDAMRVDVAPLPSDALRPARPAPSASRLPDGRVWPVRLSFTPARQNARPLFAVSLLLHERGFLDRLSVDTGLVAVTADLVALDPLERPDCKVS